MESACHHKSRKTRGPEWCNLWNAERRQEEGNREKRRRDCWDFLMTFAFLGICWWCPILIISVRGCLGVGHSDEWDNSVEHSVYSICFLEAFHSRQSQIISHVHFRFIWQMRAPTLCLSAVFVSGRCQYHTGRYIAKIRFSVWFTGKNGKTDAPRTNLPSWTGNTRRDSSGQFVSDIYFRLLTGRSTAAGLSMLYLCSIHKDGVTHVKAIHSLR